MLGHFKILDSWGLNTQAEIINFFSYDIDSNSKVKMSQHRSDLLTNINNCVPSNICKIFHFFGTLQDILKKLSHRRPLQKECIPEGCVPPAH